MRRRSSRGVEHVHPARVRDQIGLVEQNQFGEGPDLGHRLSGQGDGPITDGPGGNVRADSVDHAGGVQPRTIGTGGP